MIISLDKFKKNAVGSGGTVDIPTIEIPEIVKEDYNGNADVSGLSNIGWSDNDIATLQEKVFWYTENDSLYTVDEETIAIYNQNGCNKDNLSLYKNSIILPAFNLDASKTTDFYSLLGNYNNVKIINGINVVNNSSTRLNFGQMFYNCKALKYIAKIDTSGAYTTSSMFYGCSSLETIPSLDTSNVTSMDNMFGNCESLKTIPALDTSNVTNMTRLFTYCKSLKTIPSLDTSNLNNMNNMFAKCEMLESIPELDTSNVIDMTYMFDGCHSLKSIPALNTSKVTNMTRMFYECYSLKAIPSLDTSNVTSIEGMIGSCRLLESIPELNTSNVTNMNSTFSGCSNLKYVPPMDTSKVTNMYNAFSSCVTLKTIPSLDTSKVTNMGRMFSLCASLIHVPPMNTSKVTNMDSIFDSCNKLEHVEGIDFSSITTKPSSFLGYSSTQNSIKRFIVNGSINCSFDLKIVNLDFESYVSILSAMARTNNTNAKTMAFASVTVEDRGRVLRNLIEKCTGLGWTITGLTITGVEYDSDTYWIKYGSTAWEMNYTQEDWYCAAAGQPGMYGFYQLAKNFEQCAPDSAMTYGYQPENSEYREYFGTITGDINGSIIADSRPNYGFWIWSDNAVYVWFRPSTGHVVFAESDDLATMLEVVFGEGLQKESAYALVADDDPEGYRYMTDAGNGWHFIDASSGGYDLLCRIHYNYNPEKGYGDKSYGAPTAVQNTGFGDVNSNINQKFEAESDSWFNILSVNPIYVWFCPDKNLIAFTDSDDFKTMDSIEITTV